MSDTTRPDAAGTLREVELAKQMSADAGRAWSGLIPAGGEGSAAADRHGLGCQVFWLARARSALSALAPHLAASAEVRRMALAEAAAVAKDFASDKPLQPHLRADYDEGYESGEIDTALAIAAAIRALAGSPPSAPGMGEDERRDRVLDAYSGYAPQPTEPAEDVAAVSKAEFKFYYDRLFGRVVETAKQRDAAEAALAEAKVEVARLGGLADFFNESCRRLTAERDRLAEAARYARDAILSGCNTITAVTTIDEALSAPEQPAAPSEARP